MEPKTLLITGFEPFGTEDRNPSWEAVNALPACIGDRTLTKLLLPVEFGHAAELALQAAADCNADAILCVGLAAGRTAVTPEAVGLNVRDASIPDNAGYQPAGEPIRADGPAAIFSTLPVRSMVEAIRSAGIPAKLSYTLLHRYSGTPTRVAFVHIPLEKDLPLTDSIAALTAAIGSI